MLAQMSHDFASLQLALVDRFVELGAGTYDEGVHRLTNLQRRLGLGEPNDPPSNPMWIELLDRLTTASGHDQRVASVMQVFATAPTPVPEHIAHGWPTIGAFSIQIVGSVARTHFFSMDTDDLSPLHPTKLEMRRRELRSVVAAACDSDRSIDRVEGGSWLYATRSYSTLFPADHVGTAQVRRDRDSFRGMSHWGQFLDHRGALRANLADEFRARVASWRGDDPCLLFPIPTLEVGSPIEVFTSEG